MQIVMARQHHLLIGALYNKRCNTPGNPPNPHHSRPQSTQATSIRSRHQYPRQTVHRCATAPSSTKYWEHHRVNRPSTAHPSLHLPRFPRTQRTKRTSHRFEGRRVQKVVNVQARCGKTSSSRLRRRGTAARQISNCLEKIKMMCPGRLSHHARLRRRQRRLRHHQ